MQLNRILLKLSGEALMGEKQYGIDSQRLSEYAEEIKEVAEKGVEVAIVIGGGNIFRGLTGAATGMDRVIVSGLVTAVPIPAAVWLFGSALVGLGWFRRSQAA